MATCKDCGLAIEKVGRRGPMPDRCDDCKREAAKVYEAEYRKAKQKPAKGPRVGICRECGVEIEARSKTGQMPSLCVKHRTYEPKPLTARKDDDGCLIGRQAPATAGTYIRHRKVCDLLVRAEVHHIFDLMRPGVKMTYPKGDTRAPRTIWGPPEIPRGDWRQMTDAEIHDGFLDRQWERVE